MRDEAVNEAEPTSSWVNCEAGGIKMQRDGWVQ